jgi:lactoylglutathione lyase
MVRVRDIGESKRFYCDLLGLEEIRRHDSEAGKFTLVFLAPPGQHDAPIELTYNWGSDEEYGSGRNFGHLAYGVENIYEMCQKLMDAGVTINRPPRDGRMAFVKSPDGISIELLHAEGSLPPQEPWASMPNIGSW